MSRTSHRRPRGFTLVELLVVLGIIALLMALLTPAVMWGINAARRTRMGVEIAALADAIEKYKLSTGDYPPSFRDSNAVLRHIRMRYPKIAPSEFNAVFTPAGIVRPAMQLDEGEALVFWLSRTRNNPTYPFGLTGGSPSDGYKTYYEFDARRLVDSVVPSGVCQGHVLSVHRQPVVRRPDDHRRHHTGDGRLCRNRRERR